MGGSWGNTLRSGAGATADSSTKRTKASQSKIRRSANKVSMESLGDTQDTLGSAVVGETLTHLGNVISINQKSYKKL